MCRSFVSTSVPSTSKISASSAMAGCYASIRDCEAPVLRCWMFDVQFRTRTSNIQHPTLNIEVEDYEQTDSIPIIIPRPRAHRHTRRPAELEHVADDLVRPKRFDVAIRKHHVGNAIVVVAIADV